MSFISLTSRIKTTLLPILTVCHIAIERFGIAGYLITKFANNFGSKSSNISNLGNIIIVYIFFN